MLNIDKKTVDFLVTDNMVHEVEELYRNNYPQIESYVAVMKERDIKRVYFVACGSPLCACQNAALLFQKYSDIPAIAYSGWDFLDQTPFALDNRTLVVGVSHYGKTEEVAEAIRISKEKGAMTIGITRDASGTLLSDMAEFVVGYNAECIWEMHLLTTYAIALNYMQATQPHPEVAKILTDLPKIPSILKYLVDTQEEKSKELGIMASEWNMIYTVAAGVLTPLAYKEGIITMLEFTWTHGSMINAAEFRHGPLEVVDKEIPYVFMLGTDESRHTTQRAIDFVSRYSDRVIVFDAKDVNQDLHPMLAPMTLFVPLEYFYYYLSIAKDHNPDDRRYYGGKVEY